ncbi:MAG: MotA/TolQ/ExbB proton channel family protein [Planctomycetes bacterium]|nr:MotA/TolQ/ExbB proton channel family protein [Planctomycetota bacterium]
MADQSFWKLLSESVMTASALEQGVLLLLVALSILSWAVIIMKARALRRLKGNNQAFTRAFAAAAHTGEVAEACRGLSGPAVQLAVFTAGMEARLRCRAEAALAQPVTGDHIPLKTHRNQEERVRLAMEHALKGEMSLLGRHLQLLASAGSASPFIGLFGTVWGIMATFQTLGGAKSASLQVLAPPIAAALIATAAGLAVAIPAVMAYNWIAARLDEEQQEATCLMERVLHLLRATGALAELPAGTAVPAAAEAPAAPAPAPVHPAAPAPAFAPATLATAV